MANTNTGNWNTGNTNTGNRNTGDLNTGNWNTGNWNTGNTNTGNWNTGNWNTGNRNTGNWNTGDLNTTEPPVRIFNKETDVKRENIIYPNFFFFNITEWVYESEMSDKEKTVYPTYITTGGYLKVKTYRGAWRESWEKASLEDRKKCLNLPNWNNELFKEISGINVEKELEVKDDILIKDGKKYRVQILEEIK